MIKPAVAAAVLLLAACSSSGGGGDESSSPPATCRELVGMAVDDVPACLIGHTEVRVHEVDCSDGSSLYAIERPNGRNGYFAVDDGALMAISDQDDEAYATTYNGCVG